jgi:hypothetical protein
MRNAVVSSRTSSRCDSTAVATASLAEEKAARNQSPPVANTWPPWRSTAERTMTSWALTVSAMSAGFASHRRAESSISVNKNVTVPEGDCTVTTGLYCDERFVSAGGGQVTSRCPDRSEWAIAPSQEKPGQRSGMGGPFGQLIIRGDAISGRTGAPPCHHRSLSPCSQIPPVEAVARVVAALAARGADGAIGGSGLLAALGLVESVRDWDLTTDAPESLVVAALDSVGLPYVVEDAGESPYATRARFVVEGGDHRIDLLVAFAVRTQSGIMPVPTRVTRYWHDLPIGDPVAWARAYRAIGRTRSADLLDGWLTAGGGLR